MSILPLVGTFLAAFVATLLLVGVAPKLVQALLARPARRGDREAIAASALAAQPDHVTLTLAGAEAWSDRAAAGRLVLGMERAGFRSAGVFAIAELPGVRAQLFAHPEERLLGVVYEHPQAGHWIDVAEHRSDGSSTTWTSAREAGLAHRPEHPHVHEPGASPEALFARALRERGPAPAEAIHVAEVEAVFERAYAEETAWRKQRGVMRAELERVERDAMATA